MKIKNNNNIKNKINNKVYCGTIQDSGCYKCCNCGQKIYLIEKNVLKECPRCNQLIFEKDF